MKNLRANCIPVVCMGVAGMEGEGEEMHAKIWQGNVKKKSKLENSRHR
jgi:hypothetical protein